MGALYWDNDLHMYCCEDCCNSAYSCTCRLKPAANKPEKPEIVTAQSHYATLNPEPITVIEGWGLSYLRGNAIKYLARAGLKDQTKEGTIKDLKKAISYIQREVNTLNGKPAW